MISQGMARTGIYVEQRAVTCDGYQVFGPAF